MLHKISWSQHTLQTAGLNCVPDRLPLEGMRPGFATLAHIVGLTVGYSSVRVAAGFGFC